MELLKELAFFLHKNSSKSTDTYMPPGSKLRQLYELACSEARITDRQAAEKIYGGSPSDKKFMMLKRNLSLKLTELVLLTEGEDGEEHYLDSLRIAGEKKLAIAEKLLLRNVYHNAEKIILRVLRDAEKKELTTLRLSALKILRKTYALKGDSQKTAQCHQQSLQLQQAVIHEQQAVGMLELLESQLKYSTACVPEIVDQAQSFSRQLQEWLHKFPSPLLNFLSLRLQVIACMRNARPQQALIHITQIERLQKDFPHLRSKNQYIFQNLRKTLCLIATNEQESAAVTIKECLQKSSFRAFNRYEVQAVHFHFQLLKGNHQKAGTILNEVRYSDQHSRLSPIDDAAWLLREGFLYYSLKEKREDASPYCPNFNVHKDIQSLFDRLRLLQRDKKGYNIQHWLLKMWHLLYHEPEKMYEESGKLKIYFHRHLQNTNEKRTKAFFKALYKSGSCHHLTQVKEIERNMMERLSASACRYDPNEVIPYEVLWKYFIAHYQKHGLVIN